MTSEYHPKLPTAGYGHAAAVAAILAAHAAKDAGK